MKLKKLFIGEKDALIYIAYYDSKLIAPKFIFLRKSETTSSGTSYYEFERPIKKGYYFIQEIMENGRKDNTVYIEIKG